MRSVLAALALSLATVPALPQAAPRTAKELARAARDSVVLLELYDAAGNRVGSGSGFAVGERLIATNQHVVAHATRMRALLPAKRAVEVLGVVAEDERRDLALVRLPPGESLKPLPLFATPSLIEPGDRVVVVGSPLGLAGTISEGIVAAVRPEGLGPEADELQGQPLLQITAPISPGSSGSPVLNDGGEVIGVAVGILTQGQNVNFAIPVEFLAALTKSDDGSRLARSFSAAPDRWSLLRNLGISALVFGAIFAAFRLMRRAEAAPASRR